MGEEKGGRWREWRAVRAARARGALFRVGGWGRRRAMADERVCGELVGGMGELVGGMGNWESWWVGWESRWD
jgi:hypothetical protein